MKSDLLEAVKNININSSQKLLLSDIEENQEHLSKWFETFRYYPDWFADIIADPASGFKCDEFLRVSLRSLFRNRSTYVTAPRGMGKSWGIILGLAIMCVLFPGIRIAICAPKDKQGHSISRTTFNSIFSMFPLLKSEFVVQNATDFFFKTSAGSSITVVTPLDSNRGDHFHVVFIDEVRDHEGDKTEGIILPMASLEWQDTPGVPMTTLPAIRKVFASTNCHKAKYAYKKYLEVLIASKIDPTAGCTISCDYRLAVMLGRLSAAAMADERSKISIGAESFAQEFGNVWTGGDDRSWIKLGKLTRLRRVINWDKKRSPKHDSFYILGCDFSRGGADENALVLIRVQKGQERYIKRVVYMESFPSSSPVAATTIRVRKIIEKYQPRQVVIDRGSQGISVADLLMQPYLDEAEGVLYPAYGSVNADDQWGIQSQPHAQKIINVISPGAKSNDDYHSKLFSEIDQGKLRLLIPYKEAKLKLLSTVRGQALSTEGQMRALRMYFLTDKLVDQLVNLRIDQDSKYIKILKIQKGVKKDLFSALEYAVFQACEFEAEDLRSSIRQKRQYKWSSYIT